MAAFILDSLVLRGSAVLSDVLAVELRRGTSVKAERQALGISNSKRHPNPNPNQGSNAGPGGYGLHGYRPFGQAGHPDSDLPSGITSGVMPGAGRSLRLFGWLPCWSTARTTSWWPTAGGSAMAAGAKREAKQPIFAATAGEIPVGLAILEVNETLPKVDLGLLPEGRTPPVSTRGTEDR